MKLSYEPGRVVGGAIGAALAILVYYDVLDLEGAGLWGALLALIIPPIQAEITRRFTTPTAKLADADAATPDSRYDPETIDEKARAGRSRKRAAKETASGSPSV